MMRFGQYLGSSPLSPLQSGGGCGSSRCPPSPPWNRSAPRLVGHSWAMHRALRRGLEGGAAGLSRAGPSRRCLFAWRWVPFEGVHTPRVHRVRTASGVLKNFSRKWSTFEVLVNTVPWWKLLGPELWQSVRAPLGELTCNQCSNRLKDDRLLHTNPYFS